MNKWLGSGAAQLMTGKPTKAHQNGRGIWLYTVGIHQGSSDFFSFGDDYKIFALQESKPSPLNEPLQQSQTSLCSADLPLAAGHSAAHGFIQTRSPSPFQSVSKDAGTHGLSVFGTSVGPASHAAPSVLAETSISSTHLASRTPPCQGESGLQL